VISSLAFLSCSSHLATELCGFRKFRPAERRQGDQSDKTTSTLRRPLKVFMGDLSQAKEDFCHFRHKPFQVFFFSLGILLEPTQECNIVRLTPLEQGHVLDNSKAFWEASVGFDPRKSFLKRMLRGCFLSTLGGVGRGGCWRLVPASLCQYSRSGFYGRCHTHHDGR
jgi:hypothetical protein